jgi:hypothetical protein
MHSVGERGEIVNRLLGSCGDDESFNRLRPMWLDLNLCLANNNGDLRWESKYVSFRYLGFLFSSRHDF